MTQHFVYRFLDQAGKVIYVGMSLDPWGSRLKAHRRNSIFFGNVRAMVVEGPFEKERASILEGELIRQESPEFNRNGRKVYDDSIAVTHSTNLQYNNRLRAESLRRSARIAKLREKGMTWAQIGERLGISRQRAQQLGAKLAGSAA